MPKLRQFPPRLLKKIGSCLKLTAFQRSESPAEFLNENCWEGRLNNLGVPELAAPTIPEYIEKTVGLAHSLARLHELHQTLRSRMAAAPLTDEARFVREMEEAYQHMWYRWREEPAPRWLARTMGSPVSRAGYRISL